MAKKIGMTRVFDESGKAVSVTVLEVPDNTVTQVKNAETDGYVAIQIGVGVSKRPTKPEAGHAKKAGVVPFRLKEVKIEATEAKPGDKVTLDFLEKGDLVSVTGITKGKGYQGTVKRHNFKTGPKTHGSRNYRKPGSIGTMYPEHVIKGKKMAGRMGADQVTTKNIKVAEVLNEKKLVLLNGAVPGPNKAYVMIKKIKSAKPKEEVVEEKE